MSLRSRHFCALLFSTLLILCTNIISAAPDASNALAERIARAHQSGTSFTEVTLFTPSTGTSHAAILGKETILQPLSSSASGLFLAEPAAVAITVQTAQGGSYTLEMLRSHPTDEAPDMGVIDASGRHSVSYTSGLHYQGILAGDGTSLATMSVFPNGDVMMLFSNEDGNFVLGKLDDGSGKYILYNDRDMKDRPASPCTTLDPPPGIYNEDPGKNAKTASPLQCNKVRVYWEVDSTFYASRNHSLTTTQNYMMGLFNQFQALYAREQIAMELSALYIWTSKSHYTTNTSSNGLSTFRRYWNSMSNGFNGDIASLFTKVGGLGGVAYVDILCTRNNAYGFADIQGSYNTIPTYSWDVEVITHETGHNLGSKHTHWCGWMTGAGGTCGSIDNCTTQEATSACASCGSLLDKNVSGWQGTIMSYCHLISKGINLANGFGPLPGNFIRNKVANSSCLKSTLNVKLTPSAICNGTGAVTLQFAPNNFGTLPYTYFWTGGAKTQNLANITSPGIYDVRVTDSNGCYADFSADVMNAPSSGVGINPGIAMPICCNSFNEPLRLQAGLPQSLTACQTVYWLRSSMPLVSLADAKTYMDTTAAVNVMKSTNESSIANNVTGAVLSLQPEPCATPVTWYYTPIVAELPHPADSFTSTSSTTSAHNVSSTQIGVSVTLPAPATGPGQCDLLDTPTVKSLVATVTNYTGRANRMRIIVANSAGTVLYQSRALSGNGTYGIPDTAITGDFLQSIKVTVMDYNCTVSGSTTTCVSSSASVSVSRKAVYGSRPARLAPNCTVVTPIKVDFAPDGCTKLVVSPVTKTSTLAVIPNPASSSVTMRFNLQQSTTLEWKVTDMAGRIMTSGRQTFLSGTHNSNLDLTQWPRGIYLISLTDGGSLDERVKLTLN